MTTHELEASFSQHRLNGEPIPSDLMLLLPHSDMLQELLNIEVRFEPDWAPWEDTSYLSESDRTNPDIMANVYAMAETNAMMSFVAKHEMEGYVGYWRGPEKRLIAISPLVRLDNEGQYQFCPGSSFAEAILSFTWSHEDFVTARDWMKGVGVQVAADSIDDLTYPSSDPTPQQVRESLYTRYLADAGK